MTHLFYDVKFNLIRQLKNYHFLLIALFSVFLGFLCVPAATDGYEIFYLEGIRGLYNSAWLGALSAVLSTILLWLPGFYLLRSQISEDERLKVGPMIAASPVGKLRYMIGKAISNFFVLLTLEIIFVVCLMAMQLIRHESMEIVILDYIRPVLFLAIPYLLILAALTVLFDVVPGMKGVFGNVLFFVLTIALLSASTAVKDNRYDLFGIGMVLSEMVRGARAFYPGISLESGSLGYYPMAEAPSTFVWEGIGWSGDFILTRLVWIGAAAILVLVASLMFNRFRDERSRMIAKTGATGHSAISAGRLSVPGTSVPSLSPVTVSKRIQLFWLIRSECKMMLSGMPLWWHFTVAAAIVLGLVALPGGQAPSPWISLILFLPLPIWSQMGCREKYFFTQELVSSSCPAIRKFWASWCSGLFFSLLVSSGVILHFTLESDWLRLIHWLAGIVFIPTLALVLGRLRGTRKLFEALFIIWMYVGPLNQLGMLDFLGLTEGFPLLYAGLTGVLLLLGMFTEIRKVSAGV